MDIERSWTDLPEVLEDLKATTGGTWSSREQMDAVSALPGARASEVVERLLVLCPIVAGRSPRGAIMTASERLGIARRTVHYLLDRLAIEPPVEAVTPRAGSGRTTRTASRQTVDPRLELIDAELARLLEQNRAVTLADAGRHLMRVLGERGHAPPAALTVSRRLDMMRTKLGVAAGLGARVLVATSPIAAAGYSDGAFVPLCAALIVDADAGTVLAWGVAPVWRGGSALLSAILSYEEQVDDLRSLGAAKELEAFEVVLPPDVLGAPSIEASGRGPLTKAGLKRLLGGAPAASILRPRASRLRREINEKEMMSWLVLDRRTVPLVLGGQFAISGLRKAPSSARPDALDGLAGRLSQLRQSIPPAPAEMLDDLNSAASV